MNDITDIKTMNVGLVWFWFFCVTKRAKRVTAFLFALFGIYRKHVIDPVDLYGLETLRSQKL